MSDLAPRDGAIASELDRLYPDTRDPRRQRAKASALARTAGAGFGIRVGKRTVTISDVHVDEYGALVCTVTDPDIPEGANPFRFVNPPVGVRDGDEVTEDPAEALRRMVRDAVTSVVG